jgi:hypothetical protein
VFGKSRNPDGSVKAGHLPKKHPKYHNCLVTLEGRQAHLGFVFENGKIQDVGGEMITVEALVDRILYRQASYTAKIQVNKDWTFYVCLNYHIHQVKRAINPTCPECGESWRWKMVEGILWWPDGSRVASQRTRI